MASHPTLSILGVPESAGHGSHNNPDASPRTQCVRQSNCDTASSPDRQTILETVQPLASTAPCPPEHAAVAAGLLWLIGRFPFKDRHGSQVG